MTPRANATYRANQISKTLGRGHRRRVAATEARITAALDEVLPQMQAPSEAEIEAMEIQAKKDRKNEQARLRRAKAKAEKESV